MSISLDTLEGTMLESTSPSATARLLFSLKYSRAKMDYSILARTGISATVFVLVEFIKSSPDNLSGSISL